MELLDFSSIVHGGPIDYAVAYIYLQHTMGTNSGCWQWQRKSQRRTSCQHQGGGASNTRYLYDHAYDVINDTRYDGDFGIDFNKNEIRLTRTQVQTNIFLVII